MTDSACGYTIFDRYIITPGLSAGGSFSVVPDLGPGF